MLLRTALLLSLAFPAAACATAAPQAQVDAAVEAPPVPTGQQYLAMTAEQRYSMRLRVRQLPDEVRKPWLVKLKAQVDALPEKDRLMLHNERNAMDAAHGTKPVE